MALNNPKERLREKATNDSRTVTGEDVRTAIKLLDTGTDQERIIGALLLAKAAEEKSHLVQTRIDQVLSHIGTLSVPDEIREDVELNALFVKISWHVSEESPSLLTDWIPELTSLLKGSTAVRNGALYTLSNIAEETPDESRFAVQQVTASLTSSSDSHRANACLFLSKVSEEFPEEVRDSVPRLKKLLRDRSSTVRNNAAYVLGKLEATSARDRLKELRENDNNADVRNAARWAISNMEQGPTNEDPNLKSDYDRTDTQIFQG